MKILPSPACGKTASAVARLFAQAIVALRVASSPREGVLAVGAIERPTIEPTSPRLE